MLVLSRRQGEEIVIVIGDGKDKIVVKFLSVRGGKVRVGVEAPVEIDVHRREVYDEIASSSGDQPAAA